MSPLFPVILAYIAGILLAEVPEVWAYGVLGVLGLVTAVWVLLRRKGWAWSLLTVAVWFGFLMAQLSAPGNISVRSDNYQLSIVNCQLPQACGQRLLAAGLDARTVSLARGILLGDKGAVDPALKAGMREAGMSHILAVSGLHVGILYAIVIFLLLPLRWIGAAETMAGGAGLFGRMAGSVGESLRLLTALVLLWGYVFLIGSPVSAARAALMLTVVTLSRFNHSSPWGWHNLTVAALLLLLWNPSWLRDLGFQLSCLATAGIMAFQPLIALPHLYERPSQLQRERRLPLRRRLVLRLRRVLRWLWEHLRSLFWLSASAQIATLPLVARVFGHVPLLGVLQGFVVVPFLPFYVAALLLLLVFPALGGVLAGPVNAFTAWIAGVADFTAHSEFFLLGGRLEWSPSVLEMWMAYVGIVAVVLWWRLSSHAH